MPNDDLGPDDSRITLSEEALTQLANSRVHDGFLAELIEQAEEGIRRPVALLTNGMIVFGQIVPGRAMAETFDEDWDRLLDEGPVEMSEEKRAEAREKLAGHYADEWDEGRRMRQEWAERAEEVDDPRTELSADEVARWISSGTYSHLTLADVTIAHPGSFGKITRTKVMRVRMDSISAWWPAEMDWKEGRASFVAFEDQPQADDESEPDLREVA